MPLSPLSGAPRIPHPLSTRQATPPLPKIPNPRSTPPIFHSIVPHHYEFPFLDLTLTITPAEQPVADILAFYQSVIQPLHATLTQSIQDNSSKLIPLIKRLCHRNPPPLWVPILHHTVIPIILTKLNGDSIRPFFFEEELTLLSAQLKGILADPPHSPPVTPTNHHPGGCECDESPERARECTPAPLQSGLITP